MDKNPKKGFRYWYENVFKYHYGKYAVVFLIFAIAIAFAVYESVKNKTSYDFNMAIMATVSIPYEAVSELEQLVADTVGDLNGDGEVNINIQIMDYETAGMGKAGIIMAQDEYVVFIMDENNSAIYKSNFNELSDYGITPDRNIPTRVYIGDTPLMKQINPNIMFYACLADWTTDGKGNKAWTEAGVKVINAILDSK
ncbi:MAG: hypothetical protein GX111_00575 [Clostridiales bacterium]|jgi:hypothetical protein|nr:hypothetical protein [Clostridiales bacterium]